MKPEQQFDKIIRKRMEDAESDFPFDESNWEKASAMLDAERGASGSRNSKIFLLFGSLFLILGTIGFFSYKYMGTVQPENLASSAPDKNSNNGNLIAENNSLSRSTTQNENAVTPAISSENIKESKEAKQSGEFKTGSNTNKEVAAKAGNVTASENSNTVNNSESHTVNNSESHTVNNVNSTAKSKAASNNNLNSNSNSASKTNNVAANNNGDKKGNTSGTSNPTNKYKQVSAEQVINTSPNEEVVVAGSNMYENLFLKTKITSMPAHDLDDEIRKTPYDFIRIYDEDYYKKNRRKFHFLDMELGTTYMLGWNAPKGKDAKGFNGYAGLNYGFHIKKKFSAALGAQVYNISNVQQPFYSGFDLTYGFGSNGTYTTVTTNSLFYFAVPVKLNFAVNKRNTIGVGVNTAFLFNGKNTIETFNISDGVKTNVQTTNNTGYYEGTNTRNIMLTAFYTRAIMPRLKLNGEFMYGISDVYTNTAANSTKENTMGVRVGIQYTLFDK